MQTQNAKTRNRLNASNDMRLALSDTRPIAWPIAQTAIAWLNHATSKHHTWRVFAINA